MATTYSDLIKSFCSLVEIDFVNTILRDGCITVNDVAFSLVWNEKELPDIVSIYADFGPLPAKQEWEICSGLMEANLFMFASGGPIFGISSQTRQVTYAARFSLEKLNAETLRLIVEDMAAKALEWRQTKFLDLKPKIGTQSSAIQHALLRTPNKTDKV